MESTIKRFIKSITIALIAIVLFLLFSCSKSVDPEPTSQSDWPAVPPITSLNQSLPEFSVEKVTSEVLVTDLSPYIEHSGEFTNLFNTLNANLPGVFNSYRIGFEEAGRFELVKDGKIVAYPGHNFVYIYNYDLVSENGIFNFPIFEYLGEYNEHYYYLSKIKQMPIQAHFNCDLLGGYLVGINDDGENAWVSSEIENKIGVDNIYIGFHSLSGSDYEWINGENHGFTNWAPNQPDFHTEDEYWAEMWSASWPEWNDTNPWEIKYYVMESETAIESGYLTEPLEYLGDTADAIIAPEFIRLKEIPKIRRTTYWKKMLQGRIDPGGSIEESHLIKVGIQESIGEEFSKTVGFEKGAEWGNDDLGVKVSAKLSEYLTTTLKKSITVFSEDWKEVTLNCASHETKSRVAVFWQKWERIEFVNSKGEQWTFPCIDADSLVLEQGLDDYVIDTRDF